MRINQNIIFIMLLLFLNAIYPAYAAEENAASAAISYNNKDTLIIQGTSEGVNGTLISVFCLPHGQTLSQVSDDNLPPVTETTYLKNNSFYLSITLPSDMNKGRYDVYISSADMDAAGYFIHIDRNKMETVLPLINKCGDSASLRSALESVKDKLFIDNEVFNKAPDKICKILFAEKIKNGGSFTLDSYLMAISRCYAVTLLGESEADIRGILLVYKEALQNADYEIDPLALYQTLNENGRKIFAGLLYVTSFESEDIPIVLRKLQMTASVKSASDWRQVKTAVLGTSDGSVSKFTEAYFDMTKYRQIEFPDTVFQELFGKISRIDSFQALKEQFESTVENLKTHVPESDKGGGNSSGGGSFSGGELSGLNGSYTSAQQTDAEKQASSFPDMENHWAKEAVEEFHTKNWISGYESGLFEPENPITRAEFIKLICTAFDLNKEGNILFNDVPPDEWYAPYVACGYGSGIIEGDAENLFKPDNYITRQDAVLILYRLLSGLYPMNTSALKFTDKDAIGEYAKMAVSAMTAEKIVSGMGDNTFKPADEISRAQTVMLIYKSLNRFMLTK